MQNGDIVIELMEQNRIEMSRDAIDKIVQQSMFLGMVQYQKMITPSRDKIKQREAKRYLQQRGYEPKVLDEWVSMGYVHRRKDGERNSSVYYSLSELQKQIVALEMKKGEITYI